MTFTAIFAIGTPVAFETKGTVLLARGFTSMTYKAYSFPSRFTAN